MDLHKFNLIVIKDTKSRYLLKYDSRWKTYLFPYTKDEIENFCKETLNINPRIVKTLDTEIVKFSQSDKCEKKYHHNFNQLFYFQEDFPPGNEFIINNEKFKWMDVYQMKDDVDMWIKNSETISFVAENF